MTLIRNATSATDGTVGQADLSQLTPVEGHDAPAVPAQAPALALAQTVRDWHKAGHSQRAIARELNLERRKVKRMLDHAT